MDWSGIDGSSAGCIAGAAGSGVGAADERVARALGARERFGGRARRFGAGGVGSLGITSASSSAAEEVDGVGFAAVRRVGRVERADVLGAGDSTTGVGVFVVLVAGLDVAVAVGFLRMEARFGGDVTASSGAASGAVNLRERVARGMAVGRWGGRRGGGGCLVVVI